MSESIAIKEHPLLFNGEMVRAILDGRKVQTRRIITPKPRQEESGRWCSWTGKVSKTNERISVQYISNEAVSTETYFVPVKEWLLELCKYKAGHRIYVRETFAITGTGYGGPPHDFAWEINIGYRADQHDVMFFVPEGVYQDYNARFEKETDPPKGSPCNWRPSIHMHRWASRILLEITDVRIERVQDITDADAIAEGIIDDEWHKDYCPDCRGFGYVGDGCDHSRDCKYDCDTPRGAFLGLWDSIYSSDDSTAANPWVIALAFKVLEVKK